MDSKVHLAVWNGEEDPVDVFLAGDFEEWQSWQSRRNFQRKYIDFAHEIPNSPRRASRANSFAMPIFCYYQFSGYSHFFAIPNLLL